MKNESEDTFNFGTKWLGWLQNRKCEMKLERKLKMYKTMNLVCDVRYLCKNNHLKILKGKREVYKERFHWLKTLAFECDMQTNVDP